MRSNASSFWHLLSIVPLVLLAPAALAAVPASTHFQARVLGADQQPWTGPSDVLIRIWRSPDSQDPADLLFEEAHAAVPFADGVLDLSIGTGNATKGRYDAETLSGPGAWLEIGIDGEVLAPRLRFDSSAFALRAQRADQADNVGGVSVLSLMRSDDTSTFSGPSLTVAPGSRLDVAGEMHVRSESGIQFDAPATGAITSLQLATDGSGLKADGSLIADGFRYQLPQQRYLNLAGNVFLAADHDWRRGPGYGYPFEHDYEFDLSASVELPSGARIADLRCYAIKDSYDDSYAHYVATLTSTARPTYADSGGPNLGQVEDSVVDPPPNFVSGFTQEAIGTVPMPLAVIDNENFAYYMRVRWTQYRNSAGGGGFGALRFYGCRIGYYVDSP